MRAVSKIDDKQVAKMTLDITFRATVEEWREIRKLLPKEWPTYDMGYQILAVLQHVDKMTSMTFTEPAHAADKES